ncbi:MAG: hypothetical protein ACR2HM_11230 [Acidimicrobiales bacterium]
MGPAGLRPLGIGEILDVAIKIYRARFPVLVKTVAIVLAPVFVLSALIRISLPAGDNFLVETQPGATPDFDLDALWPFLAGGLVIIVLYFLASQLATGACFKAVSGAYLDEDPDVGTSLRFARSKFWSLIWLAILTAVCLVPAFVAGVLPAVYLWVAWAVAAPVLLLEDLRGWGAMKRSRQLVKSRFWPTFAVLILVAILSFIVQAVFSGILLGVVGVSGNEVAVAIAEAIAQTASGVLTTPLSAAVLTVLYFDLRVRKEGFDLELLSHRMGTDPTTLADPAFLPPQDAAPPPPQDGPPPGWPSPDAPPRDG